MPFAREKNLVEQSVVMSSYYGIYDENRKIKSVSYTVPEGTILECDRVYVRTSSKSAKSIEEDYDSITWRVIGKNGKQEKNCRFWAKLSDCNTIDFRLPTDSSYKERSAAAAAIEASKPFRLNIDEIRTKIYVARSHGHTSELGVMFKNAEKDAMEHYQESLQRDRKAFDQRLQDLNASERNSMWSFMMPNKKDVHKEMTKQDFLNEFFKTQLSCKFAKRPDNTCSRRMSHDIVTSGCRHGYYSAHDKSFAMSGLYYSIITDESDQKIIGVEVCKERSVK